MKKTKYRVNSTTLTVGAIVITLLLNAILITFNDKVSLQLDFSKDKLYELTDQSKQVVDKVTEDVEMIMLTDGSTNEQFSVVENVLKKYSQRNSKITVSALDANKNYADVKPYLSNITEKLYLGSVLIKMGEKFKVVNAKDFYLEDQLSYVERVCTNKLAGMVDNSYMPKVNLIIGHGEENIDVYKQVLEGEGYEVSEIDTLKATMPEDIKTILILSAPKVDFTAEEIDKIDKYLDNGGSVQIHFSPSESVATLERLEKYLSEEWGITRQNVVAVDQENLLGMGLLAQAQLGGHEIVKTLAQSQMRVGYYNSNTFEISKQLPQSIKAEAVLTTSESAYTKTPQAIAAQDTGKQATDASGKFTLMVAATRDTYTLDNKTNTGKLLVSGSSDTFSNMLSVPVLVNKELFLNSISWVIGGETFMSIPAKQLPQGSLMISAPQYWSWFIILVAVIPLILFITGLVVWLRRRYK